MTLLGWALVAPGAAAIGFVLALAALDHSQNRRHDIGAPPRRWRLRLLPINRTWPPPGLVPVRRAFQNIKRRFNWP